MKCLCRRWPLGWHLGRSDCGHFGGGRLQQSGHFLEVTAIARANVPIVKMVDRLSGMDVDMCFNNMLGRMPADARQAEQNRTPSTRTCSCRPTAAAAVCICNPGCSDDATLQACITRQC